MRSLDADGVAEDVGLLGGRDLAVGFWSFAGKSLSYMNLVLANLIKTNTTYPNLA